jgi:CBS domain containing-hemolysin-like protein
VVTIEDALEEIVGEIADELDIDEDSELVYDEVNHRVEAEGRAPIESICKLLGVELPESDDYDTVGGLIVHRLSEIPRIGTAVELNGLRITVLGATKRKVQRVQIELIDSDSLQSETESARR